MSKLKENDTKDNKQVNEEPADFEAALSATGYGIFNYILLVVLLPSCMSSVFQTSTMSYILPSAECDLKLTLVDKGLLNAITYAGMITSAILWGYLADTMGRKKLLVIGYLLDALCVLLGSLSPNRLYLIVFKFLGGFFICGPFASLVSYANEFHGIKLRSRIMMLIGCYFSVATVSLPIIAYAILPYQWNVLIFNLITIRSWKVFLAVCALPSLTAGISYIFLPESPKFLMSAGRNQEALKVYQLMFHLNTGKPKDQYPIKQLIMEIPQKKSNTENNSIEEGERKKDHSEGTISSFQTSLAQLRPMFHKQYLGLSILVYLLQFCALLGLNTFRLWVPQLFAIVSSYENHALNENGTSASNLCLMISYNINRTAQNVEASTIHDCVVDVDTKTYFNSAIVGLTQLVSYFVAGALINAVGNKRIFIMGLTLSGIMGISLFWATNSLMTVIFSSIYVAVGSIGSTALVGMIAILFPTTLRTMIVSLAMMFGRTGALIGNTLFPVLMASGCAPPFIMVGGIMFLSAIMAFFLPSNINKRPLE